MTVREVFNQLVPNSMSYHLVKGRNTGETFYKELAVGYKFSFPKALIIIGFNSETKQTSSPITFVKLNGCSVKKENDVFYAKAKDRTIAFHCDSEDEDFLRFFKEGL